MTQYKSMDHTISPAGDDHTEDGSACSSIHSSLCATIVSTDAISNRSAKKKLFFAATLATLFFFTELVAGYLSNSLALMSDAFHLLTDVASFSIALAAIYMAQKQPTKRLTFGFHRAQVLSALSSVIIIWILTAVLVMRAIDRVNHPQVINAKLMCMTAAIGVTVNIALAFVLGDHGSTKPCKASTNTKHVFKHGDEEEQHCHLLETTQASPLSVENSNINVRAAALHVLGDLVASVGVLVSSIILIFKPSYTIVDPLCTFFFSAIVLYTTYHLACDSLAILMEGTPENVNVDDLQHFLLQVPNVVAVKDLHVWSLSPDRTSLTAHIVIPRSPLTCPDDVLLSCHRVIKERFGIHHITIQIQYEPLPPSLTPHSIEV